jgi:hypothetical protein
MRLFPARTADRPGQQFNAAVGRTLLQNVPESIRRDRDHLGLLQRDQAVLPLSCLRSFGRYSWVEFISFTKDCT